MGQWSTPLVATAGGVRHEDFKSTVQSYEALHTSFGGDHATRKREYAEMVNKYYDLATTFYEYGWGTSFHFAHRLKGESHEASLKRHEHYLALKLQLRPHHKVLDVGCGVGGPLREIALFSGASVTGINNNSFQLRRAAMHTEAAGQGLSERCSYVKGDFMAMPFADGTFDGVYAIDATCHAPDAVACYKEVFRVLQPGAAFSGYEWCSTDAYDPSDPQQARIMAEIELGNGLPEVRSTRQVKQALEAAGFVVEEHCDLGTTADVPWWQPLDPGRLSVSGFRTTAVGRIVTRCLVSGLEALAIAPKGSSQVSSLLERAADGLVAGGKAGIFTPMYFFLARKPVA